MPGVLQPFRRHRRLGTSTVIYPFDHRRRTAPPMPTADARDRGTAHHNRRGFTGVHSTTGGQWQSARHIRTAIHTRRPASRRLRGEDGPVRATPHPAHPSLSARPERKKSPGSDQCSGTGRRQPGAPTPPGPPNPPAIAKSQRHFAIIPKLIVLLPGTALAYWRFMISHTSFIDLDIRDVTTISVKQHLPHSLSTRVSPGTNSKVREPPMA